MMNDTTSAQLAQNHMLPVSTVILGDCVEIMKGFDDKQFDLAIVDPPYGIGEDGRKTKSRDYKRFDPRNGMKINCPAKKYKSADWDNEPPKQEYFNQLFRVAKKVFIWGDNYINFEQKIVSSGRLIWNKYTGDNDFSDCEIAWTNSFKSVRKFDFMWAGFRQGKSITEGHINQGNKSLCEKRIHPTQKPVALYYWIIENYGNGCNNILDTHLGSGSSRIAADKARLNFTGIEIDKDYFEASEKRFKEYKSQLRIEGW